MGASLKIPHTRTLLASAMATTLWVGSAQQASAGGFAVPEVSIAGLGTANALVANPREYGAVAYNAAAAVFHPGTRLSAGAMLVIPKLKVTTPSTERYQSDARDVIPVPMAQASYQLNDRLFLTLGANAPLGLETRWDAAAFPLAGSPTDSKIELLDVNPAVAFKLGAHTGVSVGIDYYYVKKVKFSAAALTNEGDGDAWGWNAALIHAQGPWSFGLSFHSEATADIEGSSTYVPASLTAPATAELPLPWRAQAGVRYQATQDLAVEFDISRTGWSNFNVLVINGVLPVTSANHWKDVNAYRVGVTYDVTPHTQLRFGYAYDETPQPRDHFSARIPDNDRHLFSAGIAHDLGNGLTVEAAYMLVSIKDYTHNAGAGPVPGDPNGSLAYNGDYSSHVHLLGLGITQRFD